MDHAATGPQVDQFRVRLSDGREFGPAGIDLIAQWAREGRVPADAMLIDPTTGNGRPVTSEPAIQKFVQAPPTISTGVQPAEAPAFIPYKNPAALVGYYFAVFSLIPLIGVVLGIPAVILGVIGLVKRSRNPQVRGLAHALVAIILGSITTIAYGLLIFAMMASA